MLDKNKEKERRKQRRNKWNDSGCCPRIESTKNERKEKKRKKHKEIEE